MKRFSRSVGLGLVFLALVVACDYGKPGGEAPKEGGTPTADKALEGGAPAPDTVLVAPASSAGRTHNDEGVAQYQQFYFDNAAGHFREAIKADPNLAEAHFNLGLALDKIGKHPDATASFKKAAELAPTNSAITDSPILKKHLSR